MLIVYVRNVSKLADVSDYDYLVFVNDKKIAEGKVRKHTRSDGWAILMGKIVEDNLGGGCEQVG
jgi:hypothetical protein